MKLIKHLLFSLFWFPGAVLSFMGIMLFYASTLFEEE